LACSETAVRDIRLHVLAVANRATGKSMAEHCEEMAKTWNIARDSQDKLALSSHEKASQARNPDSSTI